MPTSRSVLPNFCNDGSAAVSFAAFSPGTRSHLGLWSRSLFALFALIGATPTLVAQQYCVSGTVTQTFDPTFQIGDSVAVTAIVQPTTLNCSVNGPVVFCQARILLQVSGGAQNFWNDDKLPPFQAGNLLAQWDGQSGTSAFSFGGQALPDPASSSQYPVNISFAFNQYRMNILAGNTLPPGLPSPAQLGNLVQFSAGVSGSDLVQYTGQTCASLPSSSGTPTTAIDPKHWGDCSCKYGTSNGTFSPSAGDPIDIASGNVFYSAPDYQTAGQNRLSFARYYNSLNNSATFTFASSLGVGWRSTYDRYLRIISGTSVTAERADGQQLNFTMNAGMWTPDSDVDITLTSSGSTWILADRDDSVEMYATVGTGEAVLSSIIARNGYSQTLNYTGNLLTSVTDLYGRSFSFTYNGSLLQTLTTPDGLALTYSYSAVTGGSRLTDVSYSTIPATKQTYVYENAAVPFALTGIIDENGSRYATWSYDAKARGLSSQFGAGANLTTVAYNDTDGSRTVTNALGVQDLYKYVVLQGAPKVTEIDRAATASTAAATELFGYDANGYLATLTDWNGNVTTYFNDSHGQPSAINEAVGTSAARTTAITYDSSFVHLPKQVVTAGLTTTFTYDSNGEVLARIEADTTTATVPYATGGQSRAWTYSWSNSLLASVQGPRTDVQELTKFAYDGSGALTSVTNALGQTTTISQHLPGGLPQTVIDPNGVTTNFTYDARQRLLTSAVSTTRGVLTTKYSYDAAGSRITTTLPDGSALTNTFDTAHRLTGVTDLLKQSILYGLDALGDRVNAVVADASSIPQRLHFGTFDALGRQTQDIGGAFQTTNFAYDPNGNTLSVSDPLSHVTSQTFDALNRPITTTDAAGNVTFTSYDAHDRLLSVTDPNGGTTAYTYDGWGRLIQQVSPVTGTTVYRYDLAGNLTQRVDARGVTTNYSYDALNRITAKTYSGNASENVAYVYDEQSPGHGFGIGRLTSLADGVGTLFRSYDERGDLVAEIRTIGKVSRSTGYSFDPAQRLAAIVYPSGLAIAYMRDVMGRVTGVSAYPTGPLTSKLAPVISGITYEPFGPITRMTYSNGVAESRTFDTDYRLTSLTDTGKAAVQNLAYSYDPSDNVLGIRDNVKAGNSQTFQYDLLNRLTFGAGAYGSLTYGYDALGNRLSDTSKPPAASPDGLGSISALTHNQAGRVATVSAGALQVAGYGYDAFGQRLSRAGPSSTLYQYDQSGQLIEETDGQGNPQADYVYLGDQPIASFAANSGNLYFLHDDRLGTPQAATDSSQTLMWQASYEPFGATSTGVGLIVQDLRLSGQEYDSTTGWYHNGFREYVPGWGRYSQGDPIGLGGGMNSYIYVSNNPISFIDSLGLLTETQNDMLNAGEGTAQAISGGNQAYGGGKDTLKAAPILRLGGAILAASPEAGPGAPLVAAAGLCTIAYGLYQEYRGLVEFSEGIKKEVSGVQRTTTAVERSLHQ